MTPVGGRPSTDDAPDARPVLDFKAFKYHEGQLFPGDAVHQLQGVVRDALGRGSVDCDSCCNRSNMRDKTPSPTILLNCSGFGSTRTSSASRLEPGQ